MGDLLHTFSRREYRALTRTSHASAQRARGGERATRAGRSMFAFISGSLSVKPRRRMTAVAAAASLVRVNTSVTAVTRPRHQLCSR